MPRHSTVGCFENRPGFADRPANPIVHEMHPEQNIVSSNMESVTSPLMFPRRPAIACVQYHAQVADNPSVFLVDKTEVVQKETVQRYTLHAERLPVDRSVSIVCTLC